MLLYETLIFIKLNMERSEKKQKSYIAENPGKNDITDFKKMESLRNRVFQDRECS